MMDRFIAAMPAEADGDLMLCTAFGVAYQKDQTDLVDYGEDYWNKCAGYEGQEIATKINAGRVALVNRHVGEARVVDIGIGSGEFIRSRPNTRGFDVNPVAVDWLKKNNCLARDLSEYAGYTFWDVLEHVPEPESYFQYVRLHACVFVSIPLFDDLSRIRASKHYRPGEHLYYWTPKGFLNWMDMHGFIRLESTMFESAAGRENIYSFAFLRNRWPR